MYVVSVHDSKRVSLIPGIQDDIYCRYKVHQLSIQYAGKNKMVKTRFTNLATVAKDIKLPPEAIMKYFSYHLSTPTKEDHIAGKYDCAKLSAVMTDMIQKVILCQNCGLPELDYRYRSDHVISICRACGSRTKMTLPTKFGNYLCKHHKPIQPKAKAKATIKDSVLDRTQLRDRTEFDPQRNERFQFDLVAGKEEVTVDCTQSSLDDDAWSVDVSDEAVKARRHDIISGGAAKLFH